MVNWKLNTVLFRFLGYEAIVSSYPEIRCQLLCFVRDKITKTTKASQRSNINGSFFTITAYIIYIYILKNSVSVTVELVIIL